MSAGAAAGVWAAIGLCAVAWVIVTTRARPRLPQAGDITGFFLRSWAGRCWLLALWGYLGWHLFCQRP